MAKKKYDSSKYQVADEMPERFAQVIPGMGVQHFTKAALSDNDLKALVKANNKYVTEMSEDEETPLAYKDIDKGTFPG